MLDILILISEDVLFWTFSTIAQTFVAFVSLLGMLAIYKIQIITRDKEIIVESMRASLRRIMGTRADGYSVKRIINEIRNRRSTSSAFEKSNSEIDNMEMNEKKVKLPIKSFFIITIFLLIASIILLPFSPYLAGSLYGLLSLVVAIIWSIISFVLGLKLLTSLIQ